MDYGAFGRALFFGGLALSVLGALLWLVGKVGVPLGSLPGDMRLERGASSFYVPIATSILVSILLTIIVNLVLWLMRRNG